MATGLADLGLLISQIDEGKDIATTIAETEQKLKMLKVLQKTMKAAEPPKPRGPRKKKATDEA